MVAHPNDYRWSSDARNALGERGADTDWLIAHQEYLRQGPTSAEREVAYRHLFDAAIPADTLSEIRERTHKGWALGGDAYQQRIAHLTQRRTASKGVGRPRTGNRV